jgi:hypothetical protein
MCASQHHISFQQYNPQKPIKRGIKFFALADSDNCYALDFEIYTGAKPDDARWDGLGSTANTVLRLCQPFFGKNYRLFVDNYYTSIPLFDALVDSSIYACGTVRANRKGLPKLVVEWESDVRGDSFLMQRHGNMTAIAWKDQEPVRFLDCIANPLDKTTCLRGVSGKKGRSEIEIPQGSRNYQTHFRGVDCVDQKMSYFIPCFHFRRWYMNAFLHITEMAIVNAQTIYNWNLPQNKRLMNSKNFRLVLAKELLALAPGGTYRLKPGRPLTATLVDIKYFPEHAGKPAVCWYHGGRVGRKETVNRCKSCKVHFCIWGCFERHQMHPEDINNKY